MGDIRTLPYSDATKLGIIKSVESYSRTRGPTLDLRRAMEQFVNLGNAGKISEDRASIVALEMAKMDDAERNRFYEMTMSSQMPSNPGRSKTPLPPDAQDPTHITTIPGVGTRDYSKTLIVGVTAVLGIGAIYYFSR